jgi:hypothetical protein
MNETSALTSTRCVGASRPLAVHAAVRTPEDVDLGHAAGADGFDVDLGELLAEVDPLDGLARRRAVGDVLVAVGGWPLVVRGLDVSPDAVGARTRDLFEAVLEHWLLGGDTYLTVAFEVVPGAVADLHRRVATLDRFLADELAVDDLEGLVRTAVCVTGEGTRADLRDLAAHVDEIHLPLLGTQQRLARAARQVRGVEDAVAVTTTAVEGRSPSSVALARAAHVDRITCPVAEVNAARAVAR